ncbi:MAG: DUF4386 domain-containing protein [Saprospiraceae bacterium]|nr:DUF4386 domain-containing protein [Saprospiraceae bacterium]
MSRSIGLWLIVYLAVGLTIPYILLQSLTTAPASFLSLASQMALQVRMSVVLLFIGSAVPIVITITALDFFRLRNKSLLLWLIALAVINFSLQAIENEHWLSFLSMSQEFSKVNANEIVLWQTIGIGVRLAWKWAHYTHLLIAVLWLFLFYFILFRYKLVPRSISAFGLVATILQIVGITLPAMLGYSIPFPMEFFGMPLGFAFLVLAIWLILRGLKVEDKRLTM